MEDYIEIKNMDIINIIIFFWFADTKNRTNIANREYNWNNNYIGILLKKINLLNELGQLDINNIKLILRFCQDLDKNYNLNIQTSYNQLNGNPTFKISFQNSIIQVGSLISGNRLTPNINFQTQYDYMKLSIDNENKYLNILNNILIRINQIRWIKTNLNNYREYAKAS